jgi:deoxyadenosine/deoxycytidine kinase
MAERYKQQKDLVGQQDLFRTLTISDYLFTKCLLFAKVNLPDDEFRLYQRLFDIMHHQMIQPELLIYLHSPVSKLQENIKKRNRPYEQNIQNDYLYNIQQTYTHYIKQHNMKTLFVDTSNADFIGNPKHLDTILDALEKEYEDGQHFISLP